MKNIIRLESDLGIYLIFFDFLFCMGYNWLTMLCQFQVSSKGRDTAIYTHPPLNCPPIQAAMWHWEELHMLFNRSLLVIHFKYSSVYTSTNELFPNYPFPSSFPHGNHKHIL